jgi:hypothetical protein
MKKRGGRLGSPFASYAHTPGEENPGGGHNREVWPGVAGIGSGQQRAGGYKAGEDEVDKCFHVNDLYNLPGLNQVLPPAMTWYIRTRLDLCGIIRWLLFARL